MTYPSGLSPRYEAPLLITGPLVARPGEPNPLPTAVFAPNELSLPGNAAAALLGAGVLDTSYTVRAFEIASCCAYRIAYSSTCSLCNLIHQSFLSGILGTECRML